MSFATPFALLALVIVPLLVAGYLWQLRRKRKNAVRYSSVALIRQAMPKRSQWHRHVPPALFLVAIAALMFGAARPRISENVSLNKTSIILTLDVSGSMCATDVAPNRLTAAQNAAKEFIEHQVAGTRIGIIAFSNFAQLVVPPTRDKGELTRAIDGLTTSRGTVIGAATLQAIDAIASVDPNVAPVDADVQAQATEGGRDPGGNGDATPPDTTPAPVPAQGYVPDIVVLLTDGANTRGISPIDAAKQAAARRVRVYTIGFGTDQPTSLVCSAAQLGAGGFDGGPGGGPNGGQGNGGFGGRRNFLERDETTLKAVAAATGGTYHAAEDADQLRDVFAKLPSDIQNQHEEHEITVWFVVAGALLVFGALGLSLRWNRT
jgi:Ca-activated chloride channel homolog